QPHSCACAGASQCGGGGRDRTGVIPFGSISRKKFRPRGSAPTTERATAEVISPAWLIRTNGVFPCVPSRLLLSRRPPLSRSPLLARRPRTHNTDSAAVDFMVAGTAAAAVGAAAAGMAADGARQ